MNKSLFIILMISISFNSFAQTEKGKILVSGDTDLSFTSVTADRDNQQVNNSLKVNQLSINPSISYFVIDKLALGLSVNIEDSKIDNYESNSLLIGPSLRYYVGSNSTKPFFIADFLFGNQSDNSNSSTDKTKVSGWDVGAGVAVFINHYASLDVSLGYGTFTFKNDNNDKTKAYGLDVSIGFSLFF
nr:outer membrane beta-barrel protein [uncultured Carboxylicivirga sp.]